MGIVSRSTAETSDSLSSDTTEVLLFRIILLGEVFSGQILEVLVILFSLWLYMSLVYWCCIFFVSSNIVTLESTCFKLGSRSWNNIPLGLLLLEECLKSLEICFKKSLSRPGQSDRSRPVFDSISNSTCLPFPLLVLSQHFSY